MKTPSQTNPLRTPGQVQLRFRPRQPVLQRQRPLRAFGKLLLRPVDLFTPLANLLFEIADPVETTRGLAFERIHYFPVSRAGVPKFLFEAAHFLRISGTDGRGVLLRGSAHAPDIGREWFRVLPVDRRSQSRPFLCRRSGPRPTHCSAPVPPAAVHDSPEAPHAPPASG